MPIKQTAGLVKKLLITKTAITILLKTTRVLLISTKFQNFPLTMLITVNIMTRIKQNLTQLLVTVLVTILIIIDPTAIIISVIIQIIIIAVAIRM